MLKFARHRIVRHQPTRHSLCRFIWLLVAAVLLIGESAAQDSAPESSHEVPLRLLSTWEGHSDQVRSVAFSPDGEQAATGSFDGTARLWDVQTGKSVRTLSWGAEGKQGPAVRRVVFSPDGKRLLRAGSQGKIAVDDLEGDGPSLEYEGHRRANSVWAAAFSPEGERIVSGDQNGLVHCWDFNSGELVWEFTRHGEVIYDLNYSSDGRWILSCARDGHSDGDREDPIHT